MDRSERFYLITRLLRSRRAVPTATLVRQLEVSRATLLRDIEYLRSRIRLPIVWDAPAGGYRLETDGETAELPGLWFSATEAHALLAMHQLLGQIDPGMLDAVLRPIADRLERLLGSHGHAAEEVRRRIRVLQAARRRVSVALFEVLSHALLERRQVRLRHFNRSTGERVDRDVSPQRLVYYRDNWYLDAWCHLRDGLRSFGVDAIEDARMTDVPAAEVDDALMDRELSSGYGIFSGSEVRWAELRFSAARSRWVSAELWHPNQRTRFDAQGRFILEVPFSDARELAMDIMKHGSEVEVLAPADLREQICRELEKTIAAYRSPAQS